jgi:hypothetical protein
LKPLVSADEEGLQQRFKRYFVAGLRTASVLFPARHRSREFGDYPLGIIIIIISIIASLVHTSARHLTRHSTRYHTAAIFSKPASYPPGVALQSSMSRILHAGQLATRRFSCYFRSLRLYELISNNYSLS